jgi:hypothetical protein
VSWYLANIVRIAANTQAAIDCFVARRLAAMTAVALLIVVIREHPLLESPASPMPLFRQARSESAMNGSRRSRSSWACDHRIARRLPGGAELSHTCATDRRGGAPGVSEHGGRDCRLSRRMHGGIFISDYAARCADARSATGESHARCGRCELRSGAGRTCRRCTPDDIPRPLRVCRRSVRSRCDNGSRFSS